MDLIWTWSNRDFFFKTKEEIWLWTGYWDNIKWLLLILLGVMMVLQISVFWRDAYWSKQGWDDMVSGTQARSSRALQLECEFFLLLSALKRLAGTWLSLQLDGEKAQREVEQELSHPQPHARWPTDFPRQAGCEKGENWPVPHTSCTELPASPPGCSECSMFASVTWSPFLQSTGSKGMYPLLWDSPTDLGPHSLPWGSSPLSYFIFVCWTDCLLC